MNEDLLVQMLNTVEDHMEMLVDRKRLVWEAIILAIVPEVAGGSRSEDNAASSSAIAGVVRTGSGEESDDNRDVGSTLQLAIVRRAQLEAVAETPNRHCASRIDHDVATPTAVTDTSARTAPRNHTPSTPTIEQLMMKKLVAFSPSKESWMKNKIYKCVGTAYIVGRVCRRVKKPKNGAVLQVMWLDTQFQNAVEPLSVMIVQRGIENYQALVRVPNKPAWRDLTDKVIKEELNLNLPLDDLELGPDEECFERYDPEVFMPASLAEVEAVKRMRFEADMEMEIPSDLYEHTDDNTAPLSLPDHSHLFTHSATSSFFAYIPVYLCKQVVLETNRYAAVKDIRITKPFSMDELMVFLGIMFYMTLTDKGEYSNYWGQQTEDAISGGASTCLASVMSLRRFKLIRRCLNFRADPGTSAVRDPTARIRPLLNLLKCTGGRFVEVSRDLALDEASIACRSRYVRHLIVFNPQKPGGKYQFRMHLVCCSTTWIALNYRLHCNNSDIADRLVNEVSPAAMQQS
ncbi:Transposase [Phytophthora palmivora]|uniref:Transposase n=1 Tax=Phytophthora palmivora TaxID=4796 RepID=A0A2P4XUL2_9STRA|nr:Transposase [Phytophthora palmivora]